MRVFPPLLAAIDIGNTNITIGIFDEQNLLKVLRLKSDSSISQEVFAGELMRFLQEEISPKAKIHSAAICSVVPNLTTIVEEACKEVIRIPYLVIGPELNTGLTILTDNPKATGTDRIVNAATAFLMVKCAVIVIDMGTATTLDVVNSTGEFLGGAIVTGISLMRDALHEHTSQLPRIDIKIPERAIGRNTIEAMQAGIVMGYMEMLQGLVMRMEEELKETPRVFLTGGHSGVFAGVGNFKPNIQPNLTLWGCKMIYEMNKEKVNQPC